MLNLVHEANIMAEAPVLMAATETATILHGVTTRNAVQIFTAAPSEPQISYSKLFYRVLHLTQNPPSGM